MKKDASGHFREIGLLQAFLSITAVFIINGIESDIGTNPTERCPDQDTYQCLCEKVAIKYPIGDKNTNYNKYDNKQHAYHQYFPFRLRHFSMSPTRSTSRIDTVFLYFSTELVVPDK